MTDSEEEWALAVPVYLVLSFVSFLSFIEFFFLFEVSIHVYSEIRSYLPLVSPLQLPVVSHPLPPLHMCVGVGPSTRAWQPNTLRRERLSPPSGCPLPGAGQ